MYISPSSHSALFAIVAPASKSMYLSKTRRMPAMLRSICSSVISCRSSERNDGSPTFDVPPPISTIGRWPVFCSQRSIMICIRLPTCSEVAVASKPI